MEQLQPLLAELGVDLFLSANDRFQQIIDVDGEPMHVSVNGGGARLDDILPRDDGPVFIASRRGFGLVSLSPESMTVHLFDADGRSSRTRTRQNSRVNQSKMMVRPWSTHSR